MKKIFSFLKNNSILLFVVLVLVAFLVTLGRIGEWKWQDYVSGLFTEIIGIIITVVFVNVMFDKSQKNTAQEFERKKILRISRLIDLYLPRYTLYFNQLTNHPGSIFDCEIKASGNTQGFVIHSKSECAIIRNNDQKMFFKKDEPINYIHFSCLYEDCRQFIAGGFRSNIDCFYFFEKKLQNAFIRLLTEVNFEYYKDVEKIVIDFVDTSVSNDISDFIEKNKNIICNTLSEVRRRFKIEYDTEVLVSKNFNESQDFENLHNDFKPYQMLKNVLNEERKILHQYLELIEKIKKATNDKN